MLKKMVPKFAGYKKNAYLCTRKTASELNMHLKF